ncbi:MAG: hypothetical protein J5597_05620 [Spirochaetaceae bacterium]|nr:hypothetical protein [Spirochaetaceae bacterium]
MSTASFVFSNNLKVGNGAACAEKFFLCVRLFAFLELEEDEDIVRTEF